ncbi:MAG: cold shock domain-containing protein [Lachnospiraceae bacterium]|nr:cold shock domain-containing protein [uncultured Acetatifactor sp.]MCI9575010.1 cold shock domain-containing protein [Lachnospiraceae bacterium]
MYGRATRYFQDRGYGFILGEDKRTYFIHQSNLCGEHVERGYQVEFKPFQNGRSDCNASDVIVVDAPERGAGEGRSNHSNNKRRKHRNHKSCNADRLATNDREFRRFVKGFLQGQKEMKEGGAAVGGQQEQTERLSKTRRNRYHGDM